MTHRKIRVLSGGQGDGLACGPLLIRVRKNGVFFHFHIHIKEKDEVK